MKTLNWLFTHPWVKNVVQPLDSQNENFMPAVNCRSNKQHFSSCNIKISSAVWAEWILPRHKTFKMTPNCGLHIIVTIGRSSISGFSELVYLWCSGFKCVYFKVVCFRKILVQHIFGTMKLCVLLQPNRANSPFHLFSKWKSLLLALLYEFYLFVFFFFTLG